MPLAELKHRHDSHVAVASAGDMLQGVGASAGVGRGRARVVLSMDRIQDFEPGEILVAPQTDPSWTPLFTVARGRRRRCRLDVEPCHDRQP